MLTCPKCQFTTAELDIFRMLDLSDDHPERKRWQKSPEHRRTLEFYAWFLSGTPRSRILDIGSGPGTVAIPLSRLPNVDEVLCADRDTKALETLERLAAREETAKIRTQQITTPWSLDFDDSVFDAVVLRYVLHHFENQAATLREVGRCLKPGGVLLYSDPAMPPHSRDTTHGLYVVREDSFTGYRTYHEILSMFLDAGFEFLAVRPYLGQRGTFADYLAEMPEELADLKPVLGRAWTALDAQTKQELRWAGRLDDPFITYPVVDVALRKPADHRLSTTPA